MANEPLKVGKPLLESSSEMDKLQCITNTEHSPDTKITKIDGDKISCSRILGDGDFQLTENWSAKTLVEESQKCNILFPRSSGKKFPEKSVQKILEHL